MTENLNWTSDFGGMTFPNIYFLTKNDNGIATYKDNIVYFVDEERLRYPKDAPNYLGYNPNIHFLNNQHIDTLDNPEELVLDIKGSDNARNFLREKGLPLPPALEVVFKGGEKQWNKKEYNYFFKPLGISNAQKLTPVGLINRRQVGDLNVQRCNEHNKTVSNNLIKYDVLTQQLFYFVKDELRVIKGNDNIIVFLGERGIPLPSSLHKSVSKGGSKRMKTTKRRRKSQKIYKKRTLCKKRV